MPPKENSAKAAKRCASPAALARALTLQSLASIYAHSPCHRGGTGDGVPPAPVTIPLTFPEFTAESLAAERFAVRSCLHTCRAGSVSVAVLSALFVFFVISFNVCLF